MNPAPSTVRDDSSPPRFQRFGGIDRLYGRGAAEKLHAAHVAVIGLGGVGSWTVEALARSGVGAFTLIDMDDVCITNTNRQLPALEEKIGHPKAAVIAERVQSINPECRVTTILEFLTQINCDQLLEPRYDFVIDCTDRMSIKALIIAQSLTRGMRVLTVGGSGGRRNATFVRAGDLAQTSGDLLLKLVRRKLRADYGWAKGNGNFYDVPAVFSAEPQVYPWSNGQVCDAPEEGANLRMDCASGFGAACFVTGTFGFVAAGEVVKRLVV
ncbi:MAG: tRNA threonylcarbamoyladenosine dehydratase [Verrucomicrobiota bacterium]